MVPQYTCIKKDPNHFSNYEGPFFFKHTARSRLGIWACKTFQYPLIREYALNYSRIPNAIRGIFLNYGILEGLGR